MVPWGMRIASQRSGPSRIGQLTGTTDDAWLDLVDVQGWPLLTDTGLWGLWGVDLGANTEHADGRLYFFFGDTAEVEGLGIPRNADLVVWTDDREVLRHGGHQPAGWTFVLRAGSRRVRRTRSASRTGASARSAMASSGLRTKTPPGRCVRWAASTVCGVGTFISPAGRGREPPTPAASSSGASAAGAAASSQAAGATSSRDFLPRRS
jgi:hypothetical protein